MNGFVFNTRRPPFDDIRTREALGHLLDFDWINRNLYFGLLQRSDSYFAGSDLASTGHAADDRERELLAPFQAAVRADVLDGRWIPATSDGTGRDRASAKRALALLKEAGWIVQGNALLKDGSGDPLTFEMLVNSRQQERLALHFAESLRRIGIRPRVRFVDDVQYWRRLSTFDFDMVQWVWPASASPGNEQRNRWGSEAARRSGSLNYAGASSPAVDAMIDAMLAAENRSGFVSAVRALDRTLLSGFYVVPLFHVADQWTAYDAGLRKPGTVPLLGSTIDSWWRSPP
jgi:peptide/nickel transport system substrate-binding protein